MPPVAPPGGAHPARSGSLGGSPPPAAVPRPDRVTGRRVAPRFGAQITLDAGSVSVLSYYREQPAILSWNYGLELPMEPSES